MFIKFKELAIIEKIKSLVEPFDAVIYGVNIEQNKMKFDITLFIYYDDFDDNGYLEKYAYIKAKIKNDESEILKNKNFIFKEDKIISKDKNTLDFSINIR